MRERRQGLALQAKETARGWGAKGAGRESALPLPPLLPCLQDNARALLCCAPASTAVSVRAVAPPSHHLSFAPPDADAACSTRARVHTSIHIHILSPAAYIYNTWALKRV